MPSFRMIAASSSWFLGRDFLQAVRLLADRQVKRLWRCYRQKGREGAAVWKRGSSLQSQQAPEGSAPSPEFDPEEILGFRGGAIRADASVRALGRRRRD